MGSIALGRHIHHCEKLQLDSLTVKVEVLNRRKQTQELKKPFYVGFVCLFYFTVRRNPCDLRKQRDLEKVAEIFGEQFSPSGVYQMTYNDRFYNFHDCFREG